MVKMKDSGIEWIGEIPEGWEIKKFKYIATSFQKGNGITKEQVIENGDTPCVRYGDIYSKYLISFRECKVRTNESIIDSPKYFNYGDVLFTCTGELIEEIGKSIVYLGKEKCLAGGDIFIAKHEENPAFMGYALDSFYIQNQKSFGKAKLKVVHISTGEIQNLLVCLPPSATQKNIADFLDAKCGKIDELKNDIQRQIETLEQYKKSVITEAVTKGINPNAKMKDSGIEWIGMVSEKAEIFRLKFFSYMKGRIGWQGLKSTDFIDEGPYCVTGTDFINGKVNWDTCYHVSEKRYEMDSNIHIKKGDLLMTKDGTIGKLAIIDELPGKACLNSHLLIIRPLENKFTNKYLFYVMKSHIFSNYYTLVSSGTTMDSLSQEKTGDFSIPAYPIDEQNKIADYLDSKCSSIDSIIASKKQQLEKLEEYKKSLIFEYVTGKKQV